MNNLTQICDELGLTESQRSRIQSLLNEFQQVNSRAESFKAYVEALERLKARESELSLRKVALGCYG